MPATPASPGDLELLEGWRDGDKKAGDELFVRHFESIYRFFAGKVDAEAVEDLVQNTFLACVEGKDSFRGEASFRTYLFAVARRLLYRRYRDRHKTDRLDFGVTSLHDLGPSPTAAVHAKQEQRLLLEALRRIPVDLQIALELHYWERLSGPDMAVALDIPEGTVRSRLRRAREALDAQLEALADSAEILAATTSDLDRWAASLQRLFS